MRLKADLALLIVSIFWGSAFVAQRIAGQMGSVYLFNGTRYLLAGVGAFFLSTGGSFEVRAGDVIELGSALSWTLHVVILGKYASNFEAMSFSVGQLIVCGLLNLGVGLLIEKPLPLNLLLLGAVAYTAFFSLGLCYTLQIWAQKHTPPTDAALILSLESVFAVSSGWLFLQERLTGIQIFGCVLIFVAVLLSRLKEWNLRGKIDRTHLVEGR